MNIVNPTEIILEPSLSMQSYLPKRGVFINPVISIANKDVMYRGYFPFKNLPENKILHRKKLSTNWGNYYKIKFIVIGNKVIIFYWKYGAGLDCFIKADIRQNPSVEEVLLWYTNKRMAGIKEKNVYEL